MSKSIPDWAKQRAIDLSNAAFELECDYRIETVDNLASLNAFARYISEHEDKPVDPVEFAVSQAWKEALSVYHGTHVDKGAQDMACIDRFLSVLQKHGVELAKEGSQ